MSEDLARATMYAMRALVGAMRDSNMLTDEFVRAVGTQIEMHVNYASVLQSSAAVPPDPNEARAIRHGMWWLSECVAPSANYQPGPINDHPRHLHEWPSVEQRWRDGGED